MLLQKLKLKTDQPLWLINAHASCSDIFQGLDIHTDLSKKKPVGQLILFVLNAAELEHYLPVVAEHITPGTLFWIFYPKKSGAIGSDLSHMKDWHQISSAGFRGQSSVSVSADWSGFRITNAPVTKPSTFNLPAKERKIEGIDFLNRTVALPTDALAAVNKHKGMAGCFNALSFTVKKEYVVAITEAKKEETRRNRIDKMIDALQQKMHIASKK